jgi:hypothetical protein
LHLNLEDFWFFGVFLNFLFFILFYFIFIYRYFFHLLIFYFYSYRFFIFYFQSSLCLSGACSAYCQLVH